MIQVCAMKRERWWGGEQQQQQQLSLVEGDASFFLKRGRAIYLAPIWHPRLACTGHGQNDK